jgi:hypothetical protein
LAEYERLVNSRKVDLIVKTPTKYNTESNANPIYATAKKEGIELC